MKNNLFACILLLFTMASCSDKLDLEIGNEESLAHTTSISMRSAGDSKYDVLGYGYDITDDYLNPMSVKNPVLDIDKYYKEHPVRLITGIPSFGYDKMYYGASSLDYVNEMTSDYKAEASVGGLNIGEKQLFSGSISRNLFFKSQHEYSSKYSFASLDVIRNLKYIRINDEIERISNYILPEFAEDVDRLSPERLVERYGTHVLTDFSIGGRYRLVFRSVIEKTEDHYAKKLALKSGFDFVLKKMGIKANTDKSTEVKKDLEKENQHKELYVLFFGGKGTNMKYDLETGMPATVDIKAWEDNINLNNSNLTNINWKETYPLYYFVKDPQKKQRVKNAIERYIKKQSLTMIDVKPFYCYYSGKYVNHSYFTEWKGIHFNTDDYLGTTCYLPSDMANGAVPLYRYYSAKYVNHSYFTEWKGFYFNTDRYEGIAGYIYKTQQVGTVPLYEYYSDKYVNHSYFAEWKGYSFNTDRFLRIVGYVYPAK